MKLLCVRATFVFWSILILTPSPIAAAPIFRESLVLTNKSFQLLGFNNAGDILTVAFLPEGGTERDQPVLVRGTTMLRLTPVPNQDVTVVQATGLSQRRDNGHVYITGTAHFQDGMKRAALWDIAQDGTFTFTTAPNIVLPEDSSAPGEQGAGAGLAVNKAGVMVGSGSSFLASLAVRWASPYDRAEPFFLSTSSAFVDIDENGTMLANNIEFDHNAASRVSSGLVSASGAITEIPRLDSTDLTFPNEAKMLSGNWIIGNARLGQNSRGFVWKTGSATVVDLPNPAFQPAAENIQALSINASGTALGWINGGPGTQEIILWTQEGGMFTPYRFSDLIPAESNLNPRADDALNNDAGQVVLLVNDRLFDQAYLRVYDQVSNGVVQLLTPTIFATEDDGRAEFKVKLTRAAGNSAPVTLHYSTADETASSPDQYLAANNSVTWSAGESGEKTITIALVNNSTYAESGTFKLRLGALIGAELAGPTEAIADISEPHQLVAIHNRDSSGFGNVEVLHGHPQAIIQFERVGGTDGALTITDFTSSDFTAQLNIDYAAPAKTTLQWARGEKGIKSITVPLLNAGPLTRSRIFSINANASLEGVASPWTVSATVTILPKGNTLPTVLAPVTVKTTGGTMTISVRAPQGSIIELQKKSNVEVVGTTENEAVCTTGILDFNVTVRKVVTRAFFQARIKP